jgi:hypothetical protein
MDMKTHLAGIGVISMNSQALELHLRYFLLRLHNQKLAFPTPSETSVAVNYLTDFKSLSTLVRQYNSALSRDERAKFFVSEDAVRVRDAVAHGRLVAPTQNPPFTLWKFGLEFGGRTDVEFCEVLTEQWLVDTGNMIDRQRENVLQCFKARGYKGLS